jgi:hypothetical protein
MTENPDHPEILDKPVLVRHMSCESIPHPGSIACPIYGKIIPNQVSSPRFLHLKNKPGHLE